MSSKNWIPNVPMNIKILWVRTCQVKLPKQNIYREDFFIFALYHTINMFTGHHNVDNTDKYHQYLFLSILTQVKDSLHTS